MENEKPSLRYFAENHLKVTGIDGNTFKPKESDLRFLDMIEYAINHHPNAEFKQVWCRNHYEYVLINKKQ